MAPHISWPTARRKPLTWIGICLSFFQSTTAKPIEDGETLRIVVGKGGHALDNTTDYIVSILCDSDDVALSWIVRQHTVARNSKIKDAWGVEESSGVDFHLYNVINEAFTLDFTKTPTKWEVALNGVRTSELDYTHRTDCAMSRATITSNLDAWISVAGPTLVQVTKTDHESSDDSLVLGISIPLILIFTIFAIVVTQCLACKYRKGREIHYIHDGEPKEWFYISHSGEIGPLSMSEMRWCFESGGISADTRVKLAWQDHFLTVAEMFVEGSEFLTSPRFSQERNVSEAAVLRAGGSSGESWVLESLPST